MVLRRFEMSYPIYFSEKNIHGAWVVYGALGVKQYYGYTKAESEQLYKTECSKMLFVNKKGEC
jgi:hypothetical protein